MAQPIKQRMRRNGGRRKPAKRHRLPRRAKKEVTIPRTPKQFYAMSEESQDRWIRATNAVSKMRTEHVSLSKASQEVGLDPATVIRLVRPALRRQSKGRYVARSRDSLLRVLVIPSPDGLREIAVRDSRQASLIGEYSTAVQRYLQTGDASSLQKFRNKRIRDISGKRILLITNTDELDRLGGAGVLSFESLYARSN